jgi:multiple sugar transport system permease protein
LRAFYATACASLAAYRLRGPHEFSDATVFLWLLILAIFPPIVLGVSRVRDCSHGRIDQSPVGHIMPYAANKPPFGRGRLREYGKDSYELEEAASVDGMTQLDTYRRIILPLSAPALITAFLLVFIFSWNEFMFALTFMNRELSRTVTVGVATLSGAYAYDIPWGLLAAGIVASTLPLIAAVAVFQKRIVAGLTAGGVKLIKVRPPSTLLFFQFHPLPGGWSPLRSAAIVVPPAPPDDLDGRPGQQTRLHAF